MQSNHCPSLSLILTRGHHFVAFATWVSKRYEVSKQRSNGYVIDLYLQLRYYHYSKPERRGLVVTRGIGCSNC